MDTHVIKLTSQVTAWLSTGVIYTIKKEHIWESERWGWVGWARLRTTWTVNLHDTGLQRREYRWQRLPKLFCSRHPANPISWDWCSAKCCPESYMTSPRPLRMQEWEPNPSNPASLATTPCHPVLVSGSPWASGWLPARLDTHASYFPGAANAGKYVV